MEAELLQLAREATAALQTGGRPVGMTPLAWVALGVGLGQLVLLGVGLGLMYRSNTSREQQTRAQTQAEAQRHAETMEALRDQSAAMTQAFTQQAEALGKMGAGIAELLRRTP